MKSRTRRRRKTAGGPPRTNGSNHKPAPDRDFICRVQDGFHYFARKSSNVLGTPWSFAVAVLIILVWGLTGPIFHFSDTWQLIINTGTTIVTFLMVFLIQNTQNRDSKSVELKLDEVIRALDSARNDLLNLDELSENELKELEEDFKALSKARSRKAANDSAAH